MTLTGSTPAQPPWSMRQAAQKYLKPFPYSTRYKLSSDYSAYTKPKKKNDGVCSTMYVAQGDLRQV